MTRLLFAIQAVADVINRRPALQFAAWRMFEGTLAPQKGKTEGGNTVT
jgi:hypothetical protein